LGKKYPCKKKTVKNNSLDPFGARPEGGTGAAKGGESESKRNSKKEGQVQQTVKGRGNVVGERYVWPTGKKK